MNYFDRDIEEQLVSLLKTNLNMNFTLFQFSELSGRDLLDLFESVIHAVDDTQPEKIGTEKIEATVERTSEFLRVLKYDFPVEPEEWDVRLGRADKDLIHPAMLFLLRDFEEMKRRAYLARYTEEVPIPEEIKVDPTVTELLTQHRELREQFEQVHTEYEELGDSNVDELKATIADLEADKAKLATRVAAFKRKTQNAKNIDELLKWTSKLREENKREMTLQEQLQRLSDEKRLLLHRQQVATDRIKNTRNHMEQRLNSLRAELESLKNQGAAGASAGDDKSIVFCQQQVIASNKRLEQKTQQLEQLQKTRQEAEQTLAQRQSENAIEVPSQSEFVVYVRNLKTKNETFKGYQNELGVYRKELVVMKRTEEIVKQQAENVHQEILKIEKQRGIAGFREARAQLEQVSATKADLDDTKGKTLEEMSQIVKEIQRNIQQRQEELKPYVAKLQEQRKLKAEIESKYLQAKQRYQNAISEYEGAAMELEEEAKKLRQEIASYQSKFHNVMQMSMGLERSTKRVNEEKKATETANPVSNEIKTYTDYFQKAQRNLKKETKALKEQKKTLGEQTDTNQKQLEAFQTLRQFLQIKAKTQKDSQLKKEQEQKKDEDERNKREEIIDLTMDE
ncbi:Intraflagellar transport protein 81 [Tritrichomonas musculus]|uniref:Intraflagellar transport protein 81 n=1 Tax=Tritrichomonas musculus TaxID=1915356 RepID=A0ABR2KUY4_9EUKA